MKVLKEILFAYNQDHYEVTKDIVSVSDALSDIEILQTWINAKHPSMFLLTYCDHFTNSWTSNTFYDICDDCTHSWNVNDFIPREL